MAAQHRVRDSALIDALEIIPPIPFNGSVWRVVRDGRDPLMCSAAGGRWDDGTFDVLYTSQSGDGAIAEMHFHLSRGQPIMPSKVVYRLFELSVALEKTLHLADLDAIARLGVDTRRYGTLSHADRQLEYPRTQDVAETAHFVGFDGLIAPSARWQCMNVIIFCDRIGPEASELLKDRGQIDWSKWLERPFGL
jgi:RES domain-containing protein